MPGFTNYLENKLLDHAFGGSAYTQPTCYLALATASSDTEAGTITEVSGGSYARKSLASATAQRRIDRSDGGQGIQRASGYRVAN